MGRFISLLLTAPPPTLPAHTSLPTPPTLLSTHHPMSHSYVGVSERERTKKERESERDEMGRNAVKIGKRKRERE